MEEQSDRLRKARIKKGFTSVAEAARAYGFNRYTFSSHENGNRGISKQAAERYARAFGVSVGWLLTGENPPKWLDVVEIYPQLRPVRQIPSLTMGELATLTPGTFVEHLNQCTEFSAIGADPRLGENVFEMILEDESMAPECKPGEMVAADPNVEPQPGEYAIAVINGNALFRRVQIGDFDKEGKPQLELVPINKAWPTQVVTPDCWIVGRVVSHTRKF